MVIYLAIWFITSYALGHDEKDEKMKSLWFMASMLWPFVWLFGLCAWIGYLFNRNERDLK